MSEIPPDFDLKFLPDWLKEQPKKNVYADYEGESAERPRRDFTKPRPRKPGGDDRRSKERRAPDSRPRRHEPAAGHPRSHAAPEQRTEQRGERRPPEKPIPVKVEFLPELHCAVALAKQIKASARAYPLFDLARMFLGKPDRHRVKMTATDQSVTLHQSGENGPVSLDRASLERNAFPMLKHIYYTEETTLGEPPKGNYNNVARCRMSGTLLGPTNHHGYQPALRRHYEERFSRRMPFSEYQREIEVVSDPAVIEQWKDQSRSMTTFTTLKEAEPLTFNSAAEAERHFRAHYLAQSLRSGNEFELSGEASRNLPDRQLSGAVRYGWEEENRFPGHLMNHLRHEFIHAGLYIFKHRNRVQLVSAIRPVPFGNTQQTLSDSVTEILNVIGATPKCTRSELAAKILPAHPDDPAKIKSQLASDLHWLIQAGHVIELHNGILDLPVPPAPNPVPQQKKQGKQTPAVPPQAGAAPPQETAAQEVSATPEEPIASEQSEIAASEVVETIEPVATQDEPRTATPESQRTESEPEAP